MKPLLRDCAVLALVGWGLYSWRHAPVLKRAPAITGAMPNLAMPAPSARPSPARNGSPLLVVAEASDRRERTLGASAPDITAGHVPDALPDERPSWSDRLRRPWARGAVVALFILLYAALARALRRGPGGHGFTHD